MTFGWIVFGAYVAGITLAASIASSATFVINPGFVYAHGISALIHFGVAATAGVTVGLIVSTVVLGAATFGRRLLLRRSS